MMTRYLRLTLPAGGQVLVNMDTVAYVRALQSGGARLFFHNKERGAVTVREGMDAVGSILDAAVASSL